MYNFFCVVILFFGIIGFILISYLDFGDFNMKQAPFKITKKKLYTLLKLAVLAHLVG